MLHAPQLPRQPHQPHQVSYEAAVSLEFHHVPHLLSKVQLVAVKVLPTINILPHHQPHPAAAAYPQGLHQFAQLVFIVQEVKFIVQPTSIISIHQPAHQAELHQL